MAKSISRMLIAFALTVILVVPVYGFAAVGNSGEITEALNAEKTGHITLDVAGLNVELYETTDGEVPKAELDATVVGIDSENVKYDLQVTEEEHRTVIKAFHEQEDDESVIGIDSATLRVYVPASTLESLTLDMTESVFSIGETVVGKIAGKAEGGKYDLTKTTVETLDLAGNGTEMNLEGNFTDIKIVSANYGVKLTSHTAPNSMNIDVTDGDVDVKVPEDASFKVHYTITDGSISSNMVATIEQDSGSFTYGTGDARYDFNIVNGELNLNK